MSTSGYEPVPEVGTEPGEHRRKLARAINRINGGKFNATIDVTLTASAASTTVTDARIYATSAIVPDAMTANAAAELGNGTLYIDTRIKGSAVIHHANNAQADRIFRLLIIG